MFIHNKMFFLGRFSLLETGGLVGEGCRLGRSDTHRITGCFPIYHYASGKQLGQATVSFVGGKYYIDVYDFLQGGELSRMMSSGCKSFSTRGSFKSLYDNTVFDYLLKSIIFTEKESNNFQVNKCPASVVVDLTSKALSRDSCIS